VRYDFGKVVIERPRRGSSARNAKVRWFGQIVKDPEVDGGFEYEGPTRIPGSAHAEGFLKGKIYNKSFTDVLGPIRGYLRSCVGRPWSKVYSELSEALGQGSWPIRHVLEQHVDVSAKTYRGVDGHVWELGSHGPRDVVATYRHEFYVEPETGRLRLCLRPPADKSGPTFRDLHLVKADGHRWFAKVDGIWFLGEFVDEADKSYAVAFPDRSSYSGGVRRFRKLKTCSKKEIRDLLKKRNADLKKKYPGVRQKHLVSLT
jgi:hypothetical protein